MVWAGVKSPAQTLNVFAKNVQLPLIHQKNAGVDIMDDKYQLYLEDTFELDEPRSSRHSKPVSKKETIVKRAVSFVIIAALLGILYQAYTIGRHFYGSYQSDKAVKNAQSIFDETIMTQTFVAPDPVLQSFDMPEAEPGTSRINEQIRPDVLKLRRELNNDDIIGYMLIEDTGINYPIVQTVDNEFYTANDVFKNKNSSGAVFVDHANSPDIADKNSVIYGSKSHKDIMFYNLRNYVEEDYFKSHSGITVVTVYDETVWEAFSAYSAPASFNNNQTVFTDRTPFLPFLKSIYEKSRVASGIMPSTDDTVLTLTTFPSDTDDTCYTVHARLVERK